MVKPVFDKLNLVCADMDASLAFYRRLGVDIPEEAVWRTGTGSHHANAIEESKRTVHFDFDSTAFAQLWNPGWKGRTDLKGRVVLGFHVPERDDVDELFHDMVTAGYRGLREPHDAFWGSRYAIIEDPNEIAVVLMSPKLPDRKSPPPDV